MNKYDLGLENNEHSCLWIVIMALIALVGCAACIAGVFILAVQVFNWFAGVGFSFHLAMSGLVHIVAGKFVAAIGYGLTGLDKK